MLSGGEGGEVIRAARVRNDGSAHGRLREGSVAAAGVRSWWYEVDVDWDDRSCDVAGTAAGECAGRVRSDDGCVLTQRCPDERVRELVERDVVTGILEQLLDVLDAAGVPGRACGTGARTDEVVVVVCDLLEGRLMGTHALERHALQQGLVRRVRTVRTAGWSRCCGRRKCERDGCCGQRNDRERQ